MTTGRIRESEINAIVLPAKRAIEQARAIAANPQYSHPYKAQQIAEVLNTAKGEVKALHDKAVARLEAEQADLTPKARLSIAPLPEHAATLQYTRDVLHTRWANMTVAQMMADWQGATEAKDTHTARVYRDFAAPVLRGKSGGSPDSTMPAQYEPLMEQTDDLLSTPAQAAARRDLADLAPTIDAVRMAGNNRLAELDSVRIDHRGEIVDSRNVALENNLRSQF